MATEAQIQRVKKEYSLISGEDIFIEDSHFLGGKMIKIQDENWVLKEIPNNHMVFIKGDNSGIMQIFGRTGENKKRAIAVAALPKLIEALLLCKDALDWNVGGAPMGSKEVKAHKAVKEALALAGIEV